MSFSASDLMLTPLGQAAQRGLNVCVKLPSLKKIYGQVRLYVY